MVREIHPESKHVNVCLLPVFINTDTSLVTVQWLRTVGSDVVAHPTWEQSISITTCYLGQMNVEFLMGGYTVSEEIQKVQCSLELQSAMLARIQLVSLFQAFSKAVIMYVSDS